MSSDASDILRRLPLSSILVELWAHGIYTALFVVTVGALVSGRDANTRTGLWLGVVGILYGGSTVNAALSWEYLITAFQDHGATPSIVIALSVTPVWYRAVGASLFALNTLIADCLFIWRTWIVWERRVVVVIIPMLGTVAGQVMAVISMVGQIASVRDTAPGSVPQHYVTFSTPYFSLSLGTTLLTSGLIAFRVIKMQLGRTTTSGLHFTRTYVRVIEIVVESAAFYSINLLVFIVLSCIKNLDLEYTQQIQAQLSGIAPTLLICRVALGHSRPDTDWSVSVTNATSSAVGVPWKANSNPIRFRLPRTDTDGKFSVESSLAEIHGNCSESSYITMSTVTTDRDAGFDSLPETS